MFKDIKARHGDFRILDLDMYISKYLEKYGEWAEYECEVYSNIIRNNFIVVEVGSHIGSHTIPIAKLAGTVICYEPQRLIYQTLNHNIIKNNLRNVCSYMMAVGNENKEIQLNEVDYDYYIQNKSETNTGCMQISKLLTETGYKINMVKLDDHLNHLAALHFLKIDAEFMELDVLKGATKLINKFNPVIYFEFDLKKNEALLQYVKSLNYKMYYHITMMYNPDNYNQDKEDLNPNATSNMILAIPNKYEFNTNLEKVEC